MSNNWSELKTKLQLIKEVFFHSGFVLLDEPYTVVSVEEHRNRHPNLFESVDKETFYSLFKRAFAEVLLDKQLQEHYGIQISTTPTSTTTTTPLQPQQHQRQGHRRPQQKQQQQQQLSSSASHKMGSRTTLKFPVTIVPWATQTEERLHVYVYPSSGFFEIENIGVEGNQVILNLNLPDTLFKQKKLFGHPIFFQGHINAIHPKFISHTVQVKSLMGDNTFVKSSVSIDLPSDEYELTLQSVSGHSAFVPIPIRNYDIEDENLREARATVVWLIDLTKKNHNASIFEGIERLTCSSDEDESSSDDGDDALLIG